MSEQIVRTVESAVEAIGVPSAIRAQINKQLIKRGYAFIRLPNLKLAAAIADSYARRSWSVGVGIMDGLFFVPADQDTAEDTECYLSVGLTSDFHKDYWSPISE